MKINKNHTLLACCAVVASSMYMYNQFNNTTHVKSSIKSEIAYIDTKNKSADAQFETNIGIFTEIPKFNEHNEKIKNVLYSNSLIQNAEDLDLTEIKNIVLESEYKYDEILIRVSNGDCIKYNPFIDKKAIGTLDNNFDFKENNNSL